MTDSELPLAELRDDDGLALLTYRRADDAGRPLAVDVTPVRGGAQRAADLVRAQLRGWAVSTDGELAEALVARGATVRRRLRTMARDLRADPPPRSWADAPLGAGVAAAAADRPAADLFPAWRAAYTRPGHPDDVHPDDERALAAGLEPLLAGAWGEVLPWSRLAVGAGGEVVGGVLVLAPVRGVPVPWIGDVFRRPGPRHAGLGSALLCRVLALGAAAGAAEVGLSVTDGNPARSVYERLGFRTTGTRTTLRVP